MLDFWRSAWFALRHSYCSLHLLVFRTTNFRDFVYAAALAEDLKKASMSALIVSGLVVHIP